MKSKTFKTLLRLSVAIVATISFAYPAVAQKIDAKRDKNVPLEVRSAKLLKPFKAKTIDVESYKDRQRLSRESGLGHVEDYYIVLFKESVFPYAIKGERHGKNSDSRRVKQLVSKDGLALQEVAEVLVESAGVI